MLRIVNIAFMVLGGLMTIPFWLIAGIIQPESQYEILRVYRLVIFTVLCICLASATTKLIFTYRSILTKQLEEGQTKICFEKDFKTMYVALYIFCFSVEFGILFQFGVSSYLRGKTSEQVEDYICEDARQDGDKAFNPVE